MATKQLNLLWKPNLKLVISQMCDKYRWEVHYNHDVSDKGIEDQRDMAESQIKISLEKLNLAPKSIEKLCFAMDLDGQDKILRDQKCNTSISVFVA